MNTQAKLDKSFWAMHLGMAANNLLAVVQHIERKFANDLPQEKIQLESDETEDAGFADAGIKQIKNSPALEYLQTGTNIRLQKKIMDELCKRLPFLREIKKYKETGYRDEKQGIDIPAKQLSPSEFVNIFLEYAKLLYDLRNKYTHVVHSGATYKIPFELYNLLAWNAQTTKERFYKKPNDAGEKFMDPLRRHKGLEDKLDEKGIPIFVKDEKGNFIQDKWGNRKKVQQPKANPNFLCKLFLKDEKDSNNDFTNIGLAFFAAQFLEPKYISQMIQGLSKNDQKLKKHEQLIIRAYAITHINLPRTRLETDEELNPLTLGMDMLAELHKCPDELFKMFSTEDQGAFRFFSEDGVTENLFKRFGRDRFAYLALNYLDIQKQFEFLRFAIDKGNFFFADYGKTGMIDGVAIEHRRLSKRVYCFKRMQDAQAEYKTDRDKCDEHDKPDTLYWKAQERVKANGIYRVDMLPQYAMGANNIGLKLKEENEPELNEKDENGRIRFKNQRPDCWLSVYELPVVMFLAAQGKAAAVESRIKEYHDGWHRLNDDIASGIKIAEKDVAEKYGISFADLPSDVKAYIKTGKPRQNPKFAAEMKAALEKMIAVTQRKRENLEKELDVVYKQGGFKRGKKSKQPKFKAGGMAAFIAKDAVRLQKPDENDTSKHRGKITSANFQALQTSLALFDCRKDSLKMIFERAGLTRNPTFIENLFKGDLTSLESLFQKYLDGKIGFLQSFLSNPQDCYVLRRRVCRNKRKQDIGYIMEQAREGWKKNPVNLPHGLFADIVLDVLKEKHPTQSLPQRNNTAVNDKNRPHNATFLIQKFHEWNDDGSQWFYEQNRDANSETLKRLTSFLAPEKQRKRNDIGIPESQQRELHAQWLNTPNLTTLYAIEKAYNKHNPKPNKEQAANVVSNPVLARIQLLEAQLKSGTLARFQQENIKMELTELRKRKPLPQTNGQQAKKKSKSKEQQDEDLGGTPQDKFARIVKSFDNLEKTLRHIRLQDIAIFYAVVELLEMKIVQESSNTSSCNDNADEKKKAEGIMLKDIQRETNLLDETKDLKWSYKLPSRPLSTAEKNINKKTKSKDAKIVLPNDWHITITGTFKVKNFGNFRRVINDVRFPSLSRNLHNGGTPNCEIDYATILAEFDDYDEQRHRVFEAIHALEKKVAEKHELQQRKEGGASFVDFGPIVETLKIPDALKSLLFVYRNAFAHQEYPEFVYFADAKATPQQVVEGEKLFAEEKERIANRAKNQTWTQRMVERLCEIFNDVTKQV